VRGAGARKSVGLLIAGMALLGVPGAAQGASYKFKVNLSFAQRADWAHTLRQPNSIYQSYCADDNSGGGDVHYVYTGDGHGVLRAKLRGGSVTFRGSSSGMVSTAMKVPGTVISDAEYTVARKGVPPEGCNVPPPLSTAELTAGCDPLVPHAGVARSYFLTLRGRLTLAGAFARKDKRACEDPSGFTHTVGFGGRPRRTDLNALIANKRVRSIELRSAKDTVFNAKNLSDLQSTDLDANNTVLTGSGKGTASWKVKLTRVR
jgi:hypothetical protein